jgi:hypothetical protein
VSDLAWRVIREAAWPGLAVLVAHSVLGSLFGHEPYVDPAMHFLGGAAAAFFFTRLPRLFPRHLGAPTPLARALLGFGLTCAVAVFWEFGEHAVDLYLGSRSFERLGSTLRDLLNGMLGSVAFLTAELAYGPRPVAGVEDALELAEEQRSDL